MNLKRKVNVPTFAVVVALAISLFAIFGCDTSTPKRDHLANPGKPFVLVDDAYHWSAKKPADICSAVVASGAHGFGIELGELMNSRPGGPVTVAEFTGYYRKQIEKAEALVKAADDANLLVKVIFLNSNAKVCRSVSRQDVCAMFDLAASKLNRKNVLMLIVSEFGHGGTILPRQRRDEIMAYGRTQWPVERLVVMDDDSRPYLTRETHLSRFNFDLAGSRPIIAVTDNNVTLSDGLNVSQVSQLSSRAVAQNISFELYGKEGKINTEKAKAAAEPFKGLN